MQSQSTNRATNLSIRNTQENTNETHTRHGGVTYDGGIYGATKTQDTGARGNMGPGTADVYTVPADPRIRFSISTQYL